MFPRIVLESGSELIFRIHSISKLSILEMLGIPGSDDSFSGVSSPHRAKNNGALEGLFMEFRGISMKLSEISDSGTLQNQQYSYRNIARFGIPDLQMQWLRAKWMLGF